MANKLPSAGLLAGYPRVSTGPGRTLKAVVAAGLTAGMVAIAAPAVSHVPEHCTPRLFAMAGAESVGRQHGKALETIAKPKSAEEYAATSMADKLEQPASVLEWTIGLMKLYNMLYPEADAFSRCVQDG